MAKSKNARIRTCNMLTDSIVNHTILQSFITINFQLKCNYEIMIHPRGEQNSVQYICQNGFNKKQVPLYTAPKINCRKLRIDPIKTILIIEAYRGTKDLFPLATDPHSSNPRACMSIESPRRRPNIASPVHSRIYNYCIKN